jgi:hypothetical protein
MNSETLNALVAKWRQMANEYRYNPAAMPFTADRIGECATDLEIALRALESTPAQESELQTYREAHHRIDEIVMGASVFEVLSEGGYKEAIENTVAAVAALSARTAPAEGDVVRGHCDYCGKTYGRVACCKARYEYLKHYGDDILPPATTAPVVGDDHATDAEIAEWLERHDLTASIRGGDARCAFEDAQTFAMTKTTARPAKAEGDAP